MSLELEKDCPCKKVECPKHGNCVDCYDSNKKSGQTRACEKPDAAISDEHRARVKARLVAAGRVE